MEGAASQRERGGKRRRMSTVRRRETLCLDRRLAVLNPQAGSPTEPTSPCYQDSCPHFHLNPGRGLANTS